MKYRDHTVVRVMGEIKVPSILRPLTEGKKGVRVRGKNSSHAAALDAINRLRKVGLIHETTDGLIFPTQSRPALPADRG